MSEPTYEILRINGDQAIRCLHCQRVSHNPNDVEQLYCGYCHRWHTDERRGLTQDRVLISAGISETPANFREVARLANLAGLDGREIVDVEYGIDPFEFAGQVRAGSLTDALTLPVYVKIVYRQRTTG